jgi:DNA-binding IclR family transcriptional regulator
MPVIRTPTSPPQAELPKQAVRVQVIDRTAAIFDCFSIDRPELGVGELARMTGLSKGTVHRLLTALEQHRLVEQDLVSKRYRLGLRLFELGRSAVAVMDHVERAQPFLRDLAGLTGDNAHLAVLDNGTVLYVAKVEGWHSVRMPSRIGQRLPAHCTALGKTLLAFKPADEVEQILAERPMERRTQHTITEVAAMRRELATIREHGYGVDNEELALDLRCIAAPIRDYTGSVVAAVSISCPTSRLTRDDVSDMAAKVMATASAISAAVGGTPRG